MLDQAFLWDLSDIIDDKELTARTWTKTLRELRKVILKQKIKQLTDFLSKAEKDKKKQEFIDKNQKKLTELAKELSTLEKLNTL